MECARQTALRQKDWVAVALVAAVGGNSLDELDTHFDAEGCAAELIEQRFVSFF